jgi:hypothetical protein
MLPLELLLPQLLVISLQGLLESGLEVLDRLEFVLVMMMVVLLEIALSLLLCTLWPLGS